jgi:hypothetical protein
VLLDRMRTEGESAPKVSRGTDCSAGAVMTALQTEKASSVVTPPKKRLRGGNHSILPRDGANQRCASNGKAPTSKGKRVEEERRDGVEREEVGAWRSVSMLLFHLFNA